MTSRLNGASIGLNAVAFVDESQRGPNFLMGAVIADASELESNRRVLRALVKPGQRRVHFSKESHARRGEMLATFSSLAVRSLVVVVQGPAHGRTSVDQREACLSNMATEFLAVGVSRIEFDHIERAQQHRDRHTLALVIGDAGIAYEHHPEHAAEPMLWVADGITWAAGSPRWRHGIRSWVSVRRIP